jgi:hypothetical protein
MGVKEKGRKPRMAFGVSVFCVYVCKDSSALQTGRVPRVILLSEKLTQSGHNLNLIHTSKENVPMSCVRWQYYHK